MHSLRQVDNHTYMCSSYGAIVRRLDPSSSATRRDSVVRMPLRPGIPDIQAPCSGEPAR